MQSFVGLRAQGVRGARRGLRTRPSRRRRSEKPGPGFSDCARSRRSRTQRARATAALAALQTGFGARTGAKHGARAGVRLVRLGAAAAACIGHRRRFWQRIPHLPHADRRDTLRLFPFPLRQVAAGRTDALRAQRQGPCAAAPRAVAPVQCSKKVTKKIQVVLTKAVPNLGAEGLLTSVRVGYFRKCAQLPGRCARRCRSA